MEVSGTPIATGPSDVQTPTIFTKVPAKEPPLSVETAAETPTGNSPESIKVVKLDARCHSPIPSSFIPSPLDDDSLGSFSEGDTSQLGTPPQVLDARRTMLSQMAYAIPSPESLIHRTYTLEDFDFSVMSSPGRTTARETDSNLLPISLKPSKLSFSSNLSQKNIQSTLGLCNSKETNEDEMMALVPSLSPEEEPSRIIPGTSSSTNRIASFGENSESTTDVPFDCVDDVRQGIFPPKPPSELEVCEEGMDSSNHSSNNRMNKSLVRTMFGWVEARSSNPMKAKVLTDRDVCIHTRKSIIFSPEQVSTLSQSVDVYGVEDEELGNTTIASQSNGTNPKLFILQKVRTDSTPDDEEDPPHIEGVQESITEVLANKHDAPTKVDDSDWTTACFNAAVVVVLIAIIIIASLLLLEHNGADESRGTVSIIPGQLENSTTTIVGEQDLDNNSSSHESDDKYSDDELYASDDKNTDDITYVDDDRIYPGGFFSTNNEFCSSAFPIAHIGANYSGSSSSSSWDDTIDTCGDYMSIGRAAWFSFVPTESQFMEASTCLGTDFDTQITIFSGDECEALSCVTFNDQACGDQSKATWFAEKGNTYHIAVHGYREARGDFELTLLPAIFNDACSVANGPVVIGSSNFGTTRGASTNGELEQCGDVSLGDHSGVWYVLEDAEGLVRAEVISRHLSFLPQISVYRGEDCKALECESGSSTGSTSWYAKTGETYYILVNGLNMGNGDFDLSVSWEWQDSCNYALALPVNGDPITATTEHARYHNAPSCGQSGFHSAPGMWFAVTGTGNLLTATTCGDDSALDTHISVYQNGCSSLQCIGSSGQDLPCGATGAVSWASEVNTEYLLYISGRGGRVGDFALSVIDSSAQAGETCPSSIALATGSTTIYGSTVGAQATTALCDGVPSARGIWYELEGSGNPVTLWTCDTYTTFDARVSVFSGPCDSLSCLGHTSAVCSDLTSGPFQFNTVAGEIYSLLVHGPTESEVGSYALTVQENSINDSCATALSIASSSNTYFGNTDSANAGQALVCPGGAISASTKAIWYSFIGTGGLFSFNTCSQGTEFKTDISVFSGSCFNLECVENDVTTCGEQNVVSFQTVAEQKYFVRISGVDSTEYGNFVLGVSGTSNFFGW